jgi:dephospho-CoA kinase
LDARGVPRDDARRRIELQATDEERRAVATFVIDNAGDLDALEAQLRDVWSALERRAEEAAAEAAREAAEKDAEKDAGTDPGSDPET